MATICVCGDSFFSRDKNYPGQHWSEQLGSQHEVYNLARPGASNFSIWHQVMQADMFDPDLVLVAFTSCPRLEYTERKLVSRSFDPAEQSVVQRMERLMHIKSNQNKISHIIPRSNQKIFEQWSKMFYVESFDLLKNWVYISATLNHLETTGTRYAFTLGGFQLHINKFDFEPWQQHRTLPNGWHHPGRKSVPLFHIEDQTWHKSHAALAVQLLGGKNG